MSFVCFQSFRSYKLVYVSMMYSIRGALMFLVILSVAHIGRTFLYAAILEGIEALQYSHCASTQCLQNSDEIDGYCYTWHVVKNLPIVCTYNDSIKIEKGKKMRRCKRPRKSNGPLYYLRHLYFRYPTDRRLHVLHFITKFTSNMYITAKHKHMFTARFVARQSYYKKITM